MQFPPACLAFLPALPMASTKHRETEPPGTTRPVFPLKLPLQIEIKVHVICWFPFPKYLYPLFLSHISKEKYTTPTILAPTQCRTFSKIMAKVCRAGCAYMFGKQLKVDVCRSYIIRGKFPSFGFLFTGQPRCCEEYSVSVHHQRCERRVHVPHHAIMCIDTWRKASRLDIVT